ncbi:hypothetical protein E2C01_061387 [Portunus trituberculatus]|uniref:Uncharacterized protein n=1 Tax=Portunus trituberculatus TaxID=210409 RepID=A0A5B7HE88_PORTR|nr:hypothetical protein [Portunus trituberculatus]
MVTCRYFKPLDKWQSIKAIRSRIRTYAWMSARSHAHHLIHYATDASI